MAAADILDFQNMKFLTARTVKRVELRNHAKFCRNRLNRSRDMVIFQFFKMADAVILDFKNFKFLTVGTLNSPMSRLGAHDDMLASYAIHL